jgi:hypothetical protein
MEQTWIRPAGRTGPAPRIKTRRARLLQQGLDRGRRTRAWAAGRLNITQSTLSRNLSTARPTTAALESLAGLLGELLERQVELDELREEAGPAP